MSSSRSGANRDPGLPPPARPARLTACASSSAPPTQPAERICVLGPSGHLAGVCQTAVFRLDRSHPAHQREFLLIELELSAESSLSISTGVLRSNRIARPSSLISF